MSKPDMLWVTADGRVIRVDRLDDSHLSNIIAHEMNTAKVEAILILSNLERLGVAPPPSFDWKDYLPRYYDHLLDEQNRRRNRAGVLDGMERPPATWLSDWFDVETVQIVNDWMRRHQRSRDRQQQYREEQRHLPPPVEQMGWAGQPNPANDPTGPRPAAIQPPSLRDIEL